MRLPPRPTGLPAAAAAVRQAFGGFDEVAPVVRELLRAPEGLLARLSDNERRREAALDLVRHEAPGLDETSARRLAAAVQTLTAASTWQSLRDYWDLDGAEAGEVAALAVEMLMRGARVGPAHREPARHRRGRDVRPRASRPSGSHRGVPHRVRDAA
ncbi:hypothetical protein FRACA_2860005 [Frankia canadensis]|uniref:Uncharacterized protein n=1 Tax=Frankia canadensis TaxID=1836972 RepID=A0A2I2KT69_9ACTN|nr:hypothetical protein [Frankia canadensis]SNQ48868.1 hypothetical protein FRACA_2860005 [Frankia canadensis]SOU56158.1 hypothetical protein FRACA_2860005 [Frankia canadensis]